MWKRIFRIRFKWILSVSSANTEGSPFEELCSRGQGSNSTEMGKIPCCQRAYIPSGEAEMEQNKNVSLCAFVCAHVYDTLRGE